MTSYEPARGRPSGRPSAAVLVGVALAVLVLVAVVVSLRTKSDGGGDQAATTTTTAGTDGSSPGASTTTATPTTTEAAPPDKAAIDRLIAATPAPPTLPKGNYAPLCSELKIELTGGAGAIPPPNDVPSFLALLGRYDLTKLAGLAPAGVRQSYLNLRDTLPEAIKVVDAAGGSPDPSTLPPRFLQSVGIVLDVSATACHL
jgi:hypothetical protein